MVDTKLEHLEKQLRDVAMRFNALMDWEDNYSEMRKNAALESIDELDVFLGPYSATFNPHRLELLYTVVLTKLGLLYAEYFDLNPAALKKIELQKD